jgi:MFS transporter, OFA family, oxalate/formate antiporter
MSVSILIASYQTTWWGFVIWYCIGFPAGIGIVYWVPIMSAWEWFPNNKGLVSGLIVGGYGFGAFIFGFISTAIANPDNLKTEVPQDGSGDQDELFPISVANEVPNMYQTCLIIWIILGIFSVFGVSRNPEYMKSEKIRERAKLIEMQNKEQAGIVAEHAHVNYIEFKEGLTSFRFWHMGFMLYFGLFYGIYMASVYKTTAQHILSDHTLTTAGAIGSVCNGGSRIFWATLQDKYGFKKVYTCLLTLQLIVAFSIYSVKESAFFYTLWVSFSFLCEGGHFSMFPTLSAKIFGI